MTDLNNTAYLLDMGFLLEDMPVWLSADPVEDIVEPGAASHVTLAFDTDRMSVGDVCSTSIAVTSNALDNPLIVVPVTLRVDGLRASFEWREDEPNTVTFTDKSVDEDGGEIVSWLWDFGDGGSSSEQNPVHTYAMNHTYSVTLTVTDSDGAVASDTRQVVLVNAEPVVDFEYRFVEDLAVHFIDKSVDPDGIISSWAWDFGDGTVSSEQHPIHVYSELGEYEVTLTVVDNDGAPATIARTMKPDMLPRVTLLAPVGGELWVGKHEIVWIATDVDDPDDTLTIKIEQSSDGGESWMTIADGENNEGLYIWDTTLLNKGGCYIVRITATDPKGGAGTDTSEEFTIIVISRSVVAAPNPAEDNVIFYYDIEADGRLYVYDVAGRLVYEAELPAAANAHHWNLMAGDRPISNGLYLYVLVTETGERSEVGRLVIQR
jgi:chitodextrinase